MRGSAPEAAAPIAVLVDREGLGDVMLKRPFLKALRAYFPESEIWWIARRETSMETELRNLVGRDVARVIARAPIDGPWRETLGGLRRFPRFSRVFDSRTKISTVALARFALRPRGGFYCCLPGFLFCDGQPPPGRRRPRHIAWRMNAMLSCASGRAVAPAPLALGAAAMREAQASLPAEGVYVGIAPGSRNPAKNWPMPRFLALARLLSDRGLTPVFFLGPQEATTARTILAAAPGAHAISTRPGADPGAGLELLAAQGARLLALVANDNGVGHLMGAAGTPVVSLFGPSQPDRWAPVAPENLVLWSQDFGTGADLAGISSEAVAAAVMAMLGGGSPPDEARTGRFGLLQPPRRGGSDAG